MRWRREMVADFVCRLTKLAAKLLVCSVRLESAWAGVILTVLTPCLARAEDAPRQASARLQGRVEGTVYGELGTESFGEGDADETYRERALGAGVLGTLGLAWGGPPAPSGAVLFLGVTREVSSLKLARCGEFCGSQSIDDAEFGARAGGGLDFRWVGFRIGVDRWSSDARLDAVLIPDLSLRLGSLDQGYFTAGFGAYDAQTTVRPGLYCGAGGQLTPELSVVVHVGVHADQQWIAFRGDATFEYQLTGTLSLGAGIGIQDAAFQSHLSVAVRSFN
jgi:hypothetical protein